MVSPPVGLAGLHRPGPKSHAADRKPHSLYTEPVSKLSRNHCVGDAPASSAPRRHASDLKLLACHRAPRALWNQVSEPTPDPLAAFSPAPSRLRVPRENLGALDIPLRTP